MQGSFDEIDKFFYNMNKKMKAIVKTQAGDGFVEVKDVDKPVIANDEVLIKVKFAGICGTDLHILHDEFKNLPPVIMGHEFSGEIAEIGSQARKLFPELKLNQRVVSELHIGACRSCDLCRTGNAHICTFKKPIGSQSDGAFAEYIKIPAWLVHHIPDGVSFEHAALTEPIAICMHGISRTAIKPQDFVVVLGPGPIGIISAVLAKQSGASKVILAGTEIDEKFRFKIADKLGINTVNIRKEKITGSADIVFECSGSEPGINTAIDIVKKTGKLCAFGLTKNNQVNISWNTIILKELKITFPFSSGYTDWERAISFLAGNTADITPVITHKFPFDKWQDAFNLLVSGDAMKILLYPDK